MNNMNFQNVWTSPFQSLGKNGRNIFFNENKPFLKNYITSSPSTIFVQSKNLSHICINIWSIYVSSYFCNYKTDWQYQKKFIFWAKNGNIPLFLSSLQKFFKYRLKKDMGLRVFQNMTDILVKRFVLLSLAFMQNGKKM